MKDTDIIEALRIKLDVPVGRHLYAIIGTYQDLNKFSKKLSEAKTIDGLPFPAPVSLNKGILDSIPDEECVILTENEAKKPRPTTAHVAMAFEKFLRQELKNKLLVIGNLELVFAYSLDLNLFRTLSTDDQRIILLLPGKRQGDKITMFPELNDPNRSYTLPVNLVAEDHIWEVRY